MVEKNFFTFFVKNTWQLYYWGLYSYYLSNIDSVRWVKDSIVQKIKKPAEPIPSPQEDQGISLETSEIWL